MLESHHRNMNGINQIIQPYLALPRAGILDDVDVCLDIDQEQQVNLKRTILVVACLILFFSLARRSGSARAES